MANLRSKYESIIGRSVSDRTWHRIRYKYISVSDAKSPDVEDEQAIAGLAFLRKIRPYARVTRLQALRFGMVVEKFDCGGWGRDVREAIAHSFTPAPHRSTLFRWGLLIERETVVNGRIVREDVYLSKEEVIVILGNLLASSRFQLRSDLSRMLPAEFDLVA